MPAVQTLIAAVSKLAPYATAPGRDSPPIVRPMLHLRARPCPGYERTR